MYLTFFKESNTVAQTLDDFFRGMPLVASDEAYDKNHIKKITVNRPEESFLGMFDKRKDLYRTNLPILPNWGTNEIHRHYDTFRIPKKSGGWRVINAPDNELSHFLYEIKDLLEYGLKIQNHEAAYAYTKNRSTKTAVEAHQKNESWWFLKLDMKDFFPSMTKSFVMQQLEETFPIGILLHNNFEWAERFSKCLDYAFLDGGLPQGTPLSPTLTNICMIGIDDTIMRMLWERKSRFVYTRYADDIIISSPYKFDYKDIVNEINNILHNFNAPFRVNPEKTRFGSRCGKNWNLGLMLNKDNKITLGHKKNQRFRAMLHQMMLDYKSGKRYTRQEKEEFLGQISYFKSIDPETTNEVIRRYERKHRILIKTILNLKEN